MCWLYLNARTVTCFFSIYTLFRFRLHRSILFYSRFQFAIVTLSMLVFFGFYFFLSARSCLSTAMAKAWLLKYAMYALAHCTAQRLFLYSFACVCVIFRWLCEMRKYLRKAEQIEWNVQQNCNISWSNLPKKVLFSIILYHWYYAIFTAFRYVCLFICRRMVSLLFLMSKEEEKKSPTHKHTFIHSFFHSFIRHIYM